jgi:hypothetical protein
MGGPAHPSPSTADLAALHAKANWLTVPVAGPSIAVVAPRYHALASRSNPRGAAKVTRSKVGPGRAAQCTATEQ